MKFLLFIVLFPISVIYGQESSVSKVSYRILYQYTQLNDTVKRIGFTERMRLDVADAYTKFYSENKYLNDSIVKQQEASGMSIAEILANRNSLPNYHVSSSIFQNYPQTGKLTYYHTIFLNKFTYQEYTPIAHWEITDSTDMFLGYKVQKAILQYAGRTYEVWFAPEIALPYGPWKFSGLPGLILKACDTKHYLVYEAIGIQQFTKENAPVFDFYELKRKNILAVTRENYLKNWHQMLKNPYAALQSMDIKKVDAQGNPMPARKPKPYIFVEQF